MLNTRREMPCRNHYEFPRASLAIRLCLPREPARPANTRRAVARKGSKRSAPWTGKLRMFRLAPNSRKPKHLGSKTMPGWRKWQTHWAQNPAPKGVPVRPRGRAPNRFAEVVEMADTPRLERDARKGMRVQLSPSAPRQTCPDFFLAQVAELVDAPS